MKTDYTNPGINRVPKILFGIIGELAVLFIILKNKNHELPVYIIAAVTGVFFFILGFFTKVSIFIEDNRYFVFRSDYFFFFKTVKKIDLTEISKIIKSMVSHGKAIVPAYGFIDRYGNEVYGVNRGFIKDKESFFHHIKSINPNIIIEI